MTDPQAVGILWRVDPQTPIADNPRLRPVFDELQAVGVGAEAVRFEESVIDDVRKQLLALAGVLVWVDPLVGDRDRSQLNALLCDVASHGVWVSAHPDVIAKMGTKEILVTTRGLSCGSDTYLYRTLAEFEAGLGQRLQGGARVIKRHRGNAGIGVWKVQLANAAFGAREPRVEVQDAHPRGTDIEMMSLAAFGARVASYFDDDGFVVDQPFQPRISKGIVRCYLVRDHVVGFATQEPEPEQVASGRVFGLPSKKTMYDASEPRFASLRLGMESEWVPEIVRIADVDRESLPFLWDADFLYGPTNSAGEDTWVLCEINVSCVTPFPLTVPAAIARAVAGRLERVR